MFEELPRAIGGRLLDELFHVEGGGLGSAAMQSTRRRDVAVSRFGMVRTNAKNGDLLWKTVHDVRRPLDIANETTIVVHEVITREDGNRRVAIPPPDVLQG